MPDKWSQYAVSNAAVPQDKWAQYAAQSDPNIPAGADGPLPGQPKAPVPQGLQEGAATPKLGSSIGDVLSTVGSHIANMVKGPGQLFTAPQNQVEQGIASNPVGPGRFGVAAYRAVTKPSATAIEQAQTATNNHPSYNENGDYTPTKSDLYMDALPVAGPWSRQVQNDAVKKGAVAGLAGLGTDLLAPKVAAKLIGTGLQAAGVGTQYASASPASRQIAQTRTLVPGSPSELLTRALRPSVAYPDFEQSTDASLPNVVAANPKPGVQGFADAASRARDKVSNQYESLKAPYASLPIDTTPMVQAQVDSIPATNAFEQPGIVGATRKMASAYDMTPQTRTVTSPILNASGNPFTSTVTTTPQQPSLGALDEIRKDTNAKLNSFYNKEGGDQNAALSNPTTARTKAVNDSSRNLVYSNLSAASGVPEDTIRENQNMFGHLTDVADVAGKRATVYGRQSPFSLQETLAMNAGHPVSAAVDFAGQRMLKNATGSDALVNAAVDRFKNPNGIVFTPRQGPSFLGLSPTVASLYAGRIAAATGSAVKSAPLAINPFFYSSVNPPRR